MRRPILVTGAHRSGTMWTGVTLCLSGEREYVHEPFSLAPGPGWLPRRLPYWFFYIADEPPPEFKAGLERVLRLRYSPVAQLRHVRVPFHALTFLRQWYGSVYARLRGIPPLLKDPLAFFSSEWLADRFDMDVVITIRHPAGFASSLKRLNWTFDFCNWLEQERLMRDYLHPFADQLRTYSARRGDVITHAILLWNGIYSTAHLFQQRRPSWVFVRYEDLARDPIGGFRALYERLGLRWSTRVARRLDAFTNASNPSDVAWDDPGSPNRDSRVAHRSWTWRLTPEEIERVRVGTRAVASLFYDDADWEGVVSSAPPGSSPSTAATLLPAS